MVLAKSFLLTFCLTKQEPWAQFNILLNKLNKTPSVMLWDRCIIDEREKVAKVVFLSVIENQIKTSKDQNS